jgi:hypothetical protein
MSSNDIEVAAVRGFDLFFENADPECIEAIAKDLGGDSSYDCEKMQATYMFTKPRAVLMHEIDQHHDVLRALGRRYEKRYGCVFLASEFYLTINPSSFETLKKNKNILIK